MHFEGDDDVILGNDVLRIDVDLKEPHIHLRLDPFQDGPDDSNTGIQASVILSQSLDNVHRLLWDKFDGPDEVDGSKDEKTKTM